jgi:hypothetical protein
MSANEVAGRKTCSTSSAPPGPLSRDHELVQHNTVSLNPLTDPLVQDLDHASRFYMSYCESLILCEGRLG